MNNQIIEHGIVIITFFYIKRIIIITIHYDSQNAGFCYLKIK